MIMAPESENNLRLEIGHVLFIDIVGYSKLLIEEQKERLRQLTDIVRATAQVVRATNEELVSLPTGDGMALVFRNSSEEPARCALEIAQALKAHPEIGVRMGVHSGPVSEVTDVNERTNIAGAGINIAQRVMDCGDAGHILLSKRVAEDLESYRQWAPHLHSLGECEVKHGVRIHLVNFYTDEVGNAQLPDMGGGSVDLVINTPFGRGARTDGYFIRTASASAGVPCVTTLPGVFAAVRGIEALRGRSTEPRSIQEYHAEAMQEPMQARMTFSEAAAAGVAGESPA